MIQFKQLSFWEKVTLLEQIDFLIVGAGIVGSATALELRAKYPLSKIVILERSYLPLGASTKNAGFTCFGSVTELLDDLSHLPESRVWETVSKRYFGLKRLLNRFSESSIAYQNCGSYDLLFDSNPVSKDQLTYLNDQIRIITSESNCYTFEHKLDEKFGFRGLDTGFFNRLEGAIDTGKLLIATQKELAEKNITVLYGIELIEFQQAVNEVLIQTNYGEIKSANLIIAVNGLVKKILPELAVEPARAQVIVTSEIHKLDVKGTFHMDSGYYYFRNIGNRVLFGGARNLDFKAENTYSFDQSQLIQKQLEKLLREQILPGNNFTIDYRWSGTMGVGEEKMPLVQKIHSNCAIGVRLGGMGVALGSLVGEELAELF